MNTKKDWFDSHVEICGLDDDTNEKLRKALKQKWLDDKPPASMAEKRRIESRIKDKRN